MTFTEIQTKILNYAGLSSSDATTRIGKAINAQYRRVTARLGMDTTRFVTRSAATSDGVRTLTFTSIEKIDRIIDVTGDVRLLQEVSMHDLRSIEPAEGEPSRWAVQNTGADSVTVVFDTIPDAAYSLQADGITSLSDLSGTDEPAFAESFHDILAWFVISEELLKKEKDKLALTYERKAEQLLSDLVFQHADSPTRVTRQADTTVSALTGTGGSGGGVAESLSFLQSGTGAVLRTMQAKARERVSVADFGAAGDNSTDDGPAFQRAHDALPTAGGTIYVPAAASKYAIATMLTLTKPVTIEGDGWGTILRANGAITAIVECSAGSDGSVIQDLRLEGNKSASGGTVQRGVSISGATYITVLRCLFSGPAAGTGLNFGVTVDGDTSGYARILYNRFERGVSSSGNATAILLEYTSYCHVIGNTIDGASVTNADSGVSAAIFLTQNHSPSRGCTYNLIQGNKITGWPQVAIDVGSTTYFEFAGTLGANFRNVIDGNEISGCSNASGGAASSAIYVVSNATFNRISNNLIYSNGHAVGGGYGILIEGTQQGTADPGQPQLDETPNYNELIGNRVFSNQDHGIRLNGATNTIVRGNFCYENGQRTAATFVNIHIVRVGGSSSGNSNIIQGNACVGAQVSYQIEIGAGPTGNVVVHNYIPTGATGSLLDGGTSTTTSAAGNTT
jgi:parallel beta-helix repeat protein